MASMDNTTVVGDRDTLRKDQDFSLQSRDFKSAITHGKQRQLQENHFSTTLDYMDEDRPFFVAIGKDGVTAALQKLDAQLVKVRPISMRRVCFSIMSQGRSCQYPVQEG